MITPYTYIKIDGSRKSLIGKQEYEATICYETEINGQTIKVREKEITHSREEAEAWIDKKLELLETN